MSESLSPGSIAGLVYMFIIGAVLYQYKLSLAHRTTSHVESHLSNLLDWGFGIPECLVAG